MRNQLFSAWRARRVLIVSGANRLGLFMQSLLTQLDARPARIAPGADAAQLNQALTEGRIGAVILPDLSCLCAAKSLDAQLQALLTLMYEVREAGVPLVILCSQENIYRAQGQMWMADENAPIGGETQEGFIHTILQTAADGISRGLLGDPVHTIIVRHPPCLGCGHPSTAHYTAWCSQLLHGEIVTVNHPGLQGVFLHPLDACCGALALGARYLLGDKNLSGAFNLGAESENLIANRTAALHFIRENGGTRPMRECSAAPVHTAPLLNGARTRFLCGFRCMITGNEALNMLLDLERAAAHASETELETIRAQTAAFLEKLS